MVNWYLISLYINLQTTFTGPVFGTSPRLFRASNKNYINKQRKHSHPQTSINIPPFQVNETL